MNWDRRGNAAAGDDKPLLERRPAADRGADRLRAARPFELYPRAMDTVGMPADPAFRDVVREHVEFGSHVAMQNSHAETDAELHPLREIPRCTWAGDE